jgi:hypothetical protein
MSRENILQQNIGKEKSKQEFIQATNCVAIRNTRKCPFLREWSAFLLRSSKFLHAPTFGDYSEGKHPRGITTCRTYNVER